MFCKKSCSKEFRNIYRKTPVLEFLFNKVAGLKDRLQHRSFPVNIAKFLRTPILKNICEQLLLSLTLLNFLGNVLNNSEFRAPCATFFKASLLYKSDNDVIIYCWDKFLSFDVVLMAINYCFLFLLTKFIFEGPCISNTKVSDWSS